MSFRALRLLALGLAATAVWAGSSDEEFAARFPYDLGPAEVDVAGYPEGAQKGYAFFRQACSKCHTPARALNSPITKKEDWRRFIRRMHVKAGSKKGATLAQEEAAAIVEFLAYDSKIRKVDAKEAFEKHSRELQGRFETVQAERKRRLREEARSKSQQPAPYTGAKP